MEPAFLEALARVQFLISITDMKYLLKLLD
jgi:hypothetical protein